MLVEQLGTEARIKKVKMTLVFFGVIGFLFTSTQHLNAKDISVVNERVILSVPMKVTDLTQMVKSKNLDWRKMVDGGGVLHGDFDLDISIADSVINVPQQAVINYVNINVSEGEVVTVSVEFFPLSNSYELRDVFFYIEGLAGDLLSLGLEEVVGEKVKTLDYALKFYEKSKDYRSLNLGIPLQQYKINDIRVNLSVNRVYSSSDVYVVDRSAPLSEPKYEVVMTIGLLSGE